MANLPTIAGRYQLQREIGRGGAGVVYAVKHLHTGERLAMKVLLSHAANQPDTVQRFRREMQASARVRSEHVVRVTDADLAPELKGVPFLIMELLSGIDLSRLVTERGALPKEEALWLLGQAARGLDRAHAAGVVHRDLKPENMFLHRCDDGRLIVKLLDFGVARMTDASGLSSAEARVTQDGAILGTPLFLTPEQALGETDKIGPGTDVWPVGLIAHELLTGVSYWAEEQMTTLLAKIIFKPLAPPSSKGTKLGIAFDDWFLRSCAREPGQRFASVGAQIEALADALLVDRAILAATEPPPTLRAWLDARPARSEDASGGELSLLSISNTAVPKGSREPVADSSSETGSSEISIITGSAEDRQSRPGAGQSGLRSGLTTAAAYALISALVVGLVAFGILRRRAGVSEPALPAEAVQLAPPPGPAPPDPHTARDSELAQAPGEPPLPSGTRKKRHGTSAGKPAGPRGHGKNPPRNPVDYDPIAP
jgi:serine/threonine-protein kinase